MIQRKTQSPEYWQTFSLSPADIEFLRNHLLDLERPLSTRELAAALVAERCRGEEADLRAELSRGVLYQPKKSFAVGDKIIFPAFDFRLGEVTAVRAGENPEHGEFDVLTVDFGSGRRPRNFAARLNTAHKLNADVPDLLATAVVASPEKLLETVARDVPDALAAALRQEPAFASFEDRWLHRDLLAEVHVGHLNIAEALIEMGDDALSTSALLKDLDLPAEVAPGILAFSLQSALSADDRFDQVGVGEERRWYLRRLTPPEALQTPLPLRYAPQPYDRAALPDDLARLAWELDDEWSDDLGVDPESRAGIATTTILLTYPHLASGTLPLNRHSRPFFPAGHGERTLVTLIDGRWGNRFTAWANHPGRYVAGLRSLFDKHKLPAGAYITLERRDDSGEVVVDFRPKRMRREWTRWAQVVDGHRLDIQTRKQEVSCEYDEQIIIGDDRGEEIMGLRSTPLYAQMPLQDLVFEVFSDLAGLSTAVHAKTVYSAVNVIRRCPPEPIFATLAADPRLEEAGPQLYRLVV